MQVSSQFSAGSGAATMGGSMSRFTRIFVVRWPLEINGATPTPLFETPCASMGHRFGMISFNIWILMLCSWQAAQATVQPSASRL